MFVRTQRLTLRPGWPEDAPQLAQAIGHEAVVRNLSRAPWPYGIGDAEAFLARHWPATQPRFLICAHEGSRVRLIGTIGVEPLDGGSAHELGYFITPDAWGRGYATEAGSGVLAAARAAGVRRVEAGHFVDNPASGRVLRKLGFRPTGEIRRMHSRGRGCAADAVRFVRDLDEDDARGGLADVAPLMAA